MQKLAQKMRKRLRNLKSKALTLFQNHPLVLVFSQLHQDLLQGIPLPPQTSEYLVPHMVISLQVVQQLQALVLALSWSWSWAMPRPSPSLPRWKYLPRATKPQPRSSTTYGSTTCLWRKCWKEDSILVWDCGQAHRTACTKTGCQVSGLFFLSRHLGLLTSWIQNTLIQIRDMRV